ncbi:MAG: hypothetical protein WAV20_19505 [Blastocatellia bacterium]
MRTRIISILLFTMTNVITANAWSDGVSLKPVFKPGQEYRYAINVSVDTQVTPTGTNGIAGSVHRETEATVVLRALAIENGEVTNEAIIEAITSHTTVDGVDRPGTGTSLIGQKIQYRLDAQGRVAKIFLPVAATETGLPDLIFSLTRWSPAGEVAVGQTWCAGGENCIGDLGYISGITEIPKSVAVLYKLSSLSDSKATVEGAITLNQSGSSLLTTKEARIDVAVIAAGKGSSLVEYDVAGSRIITATTETTLEGRLSTTPPTRAGEKLQPREGSVVEKAKFSVRLIQ